MLTLDASVQIPEHVLFTLLDQEAVLLDTRMNKYYALNEVGARLWALLTEKKRLEEAYQALLEEFEVAPDQLERDILEILNQLVENGLLEVVQA